ncbi:MAG: hypothetical protein QOC81_1679 [Thermoanaerobaculia bacterium]|jgi:hypothetical protein|nr:hypothetical protein [Thermoanaerobaculia bacterium]
MSANFREYANGRLPGMEECVEVSGERGIPEGLPRVGKNALDSMLDTPSIEVVSP